MQESIQVAEILVLVDRKNIKNVHLSVHPPDGRVTISTPEETRLEVTRAYVASRLGWIRKQQGHLRDQERGAPRQFVTRESHYVWGRRYLLVVIYAHEKPSVKIDHRRIILSIRPGSNSIKRAQVMHEWHKSLLHGAVPPLISKWEATLGVKVSGYYLQRMKTRWGSCNDKVGHIRINTELVKKPKDLLEYIIVHEMIHLLERKHNERFTKILDRHYPTWREARVELNELPL